ncbi:hypothetical protein E2562_037815 [Oryza meyeriana var. granulata]|uniref:Uncharacterized protein n=1 Tax=Oryza meyeriana var. granulata TaxID=110450 RepID=A0A6G1C1Z5_9ORYZ|nr:hypothetical protein E2562_037815 [Oryza meyeriana var. granulata]
MSSRCRRLTSPEHSTPSQGPAVLTALIPRALAPVLETSTTAQLLLVRISPSIEPPPLCFPSLVISPTRLQHPNPLRMCPRARLSFLSSPRLAPDATAANYSLSPSLSPPPRQPANGHRRPSPRGSELPKSFAVDPSLHRRRHSL